MNKELKAAIVLKFGNQSGAAQYLRLQSRIIPGRIRPSKRDRAAFVRLLVRTRCQRYSAMNGVARDYDFRGSSRESIRFVPQLRSA
jgi:hypothetical protein